MRVAASFLSTQQPRWQLDVSSADLVRYRKYAGVTFLLNGASGEIRTPDPLVRSQMLYPIELRAQLLIENWIGMGRGFHRCCFYLIERNRPRKVFLLEFDLLHPDVAAHVG